MNKTISFKSKLIDRVYAQAWVQSPVDMWPEWDTYLGCPLKYFGRIY